MNARSTYLSSKFIVKIIDIKIQKNKIKDKYEVNVHKKMIFNLNSIKMHKDECEIT